FHPALAPPLHGVARGEDAAELLVDLADERAGSGGRRGEHVPARELVAGETRLRDRGDVHRSGLPLEAGYTERAQPLRFHWRQHVGYRVREEHLRLAADRRGGRGAAALVVHRDQVELAEIVEQLS